jgi:hypothetical protein
MSALGLLRMRRSGRSRVRALIAGAFTGQRVALVLLKPVTITI